MGEQPTTGGLPVIPEDVAASALHGSFCPKMCNFACPVTAATGRDDALPWSFHRTVSDLAGGRRAPDVAAATHLEACSGCLACQVPCLFDQDVPSQVRAGRAAVARAGSPVAGHTEAIRAVTARRSPYGLTTPTTDGPPAPADATVVTGCRDGSAEIHALRRLLGAAGVATTIISPDGCCGATLTDLGAEREAGEAAARLAEQLGTAREVIATDPHCLPTLRRGAAAGTPVRDATTALAELVADGRLHLAGARTPVTYHDPCLLARDEGVTEPPRALLRAAGAELLEPEGSGARTVCSGAGLALELVAPPAAAATAGRRVAQLEATGVPAVTSCAGARRRLAASGAEVTDLFSFLVARLPPEPS